VTYASNLRLDGGREEAIYACSLGVKNRWGRREGVEARGLGLLEAGRLGLDGLEGWLRRVGEGALVLVCEEAGLEARGLWLLETGWLRREACRLRLLETRGLRLLEGGKAGRLGLEGSTWAESSWLGHDSVRRELQAGLSLWEAGHLLG